MSGRYDNMLDMERPRYEDLPPMSMHDRAAQFSPFAALTGFDAAIAETARLTDAKVAAAEDLVNEIDQVILDIRERLKRGSVLVGVDYFIPDERKEGGRYVRKTSEVKRLDDYNNTIVFMDGSFVRVTDIRELTIDNSEV